MADTLGDYYNILEFTQEELKADRKELAKIRNDPDAKERVKSLERDIALLEEGVDRFQQRIKILQQNQIKLT